MKNTIFVQLKSKDEQATDCWVKLNYSNWRQVYEKDIKNALENIKALNIELYEQQKQAILNMNIWRLQAIGTDKIIEKKIGKVKDLLNI